MVNLSLNVTSEENINDDIYARQEGVITLTKNKMYAGDGTQPVKIFEAGGGFTYVEPADPNNTVNPENDNAIWLNSRTLEFFLCIDKMTDKNVWIGNKKGQIASYNFGGEMGFGVGIAPDDIVANCGLREMTGTRDPEHENFGNYQDSKGNIMVWIPKMYVKKTHVREAPYLGLKVEVSTSKEPGFVLPRCFINAGREIDGLFVDKYLASIEGNTIVSKKGKKPLSTYQNYEPISNLGDTTTFPNQYATAYKAAKLRGEKYCVPHISLYTYLTDLTNAHYQRLYEKTNGFADGDYSKCAWADVAPYAPKGNNYSNRTDINDPSVVYTSAGYTHNTTTNIGPGLTGGVPDSVFAKITHNGQKNGIADIVGNQWETCSGLISSSTGEMLFLKESVDLRTLVDKDTAYNESLYNKFNFRLNRSINKIVFFSKGTEKVFTNSDIRDSDDYINDQIRIPLQYSETITGDELQRYGQDRIWLYQKNQNCIIVNGSWWDGSAPGVFCWLCRDVASSSGWSVGFRTCLIP